MLIGLYRMRETSLEKESGKFPTCEAVGIFPRERLLKEGTRHRKKRRHRACERTWWIWYPPNN